MIMRFRFYILAAVTGLLLLACNRQATPPLAKNVRTSSPAVSLTGFNLLIIHDGTVNIKRSQWVDYFPASFGTILERGDQVYPAGDATVVVLCDDWTLWSVPPGVPSGLSNGCPQPAEPPLLRAEGSKIGATRVSSTALALIPYVISPRKTHLLNAIPRLRWNPVPGVTSYTVTVRGEGVQWQTKVDGTEVKYPGHPALQPGIWYSLVVETDTGRSSREENLPGLGFSVLNSEEAGRITASVEKLQRLNLPTNEEGFAQAQLYVTQNLSAEAIEILEQLIAQGAHKVALYTTLGDLYRETGLYWLAEQQYHYAIDAAGISNDIEGLAEAQASLGEVYIALGAQDAAQWLHRAIVSYQTLGNTQRVSELQEQLAGTQP